MKKDHKGQKDWKGQKALAFLQTYDEVLALSGMLQKMELGALREDGIGECKELFCFFKGYVAMGSQKYENISKLSRILIFVEGKT